jgi:hypothetical protein
VAPHDVPSQVVRLVALRPSLSGPVVTAAPVCMSEMNKHIHNDGELPGAGGLAGYRATDYDTDERTVGLQKGADGPSTTSTAEVWIQ